MITFFIVSLGVLAGLAYVYAYRAHRIVAALGGRGLRPAAATSSPDRRRTESVPPATGTSSCIRVRT